jgi:hypothetical protein
MPQKTGKEDFQHIVKNNRMNRHMLGDSFNQTITLDTMSLTIKLAKRWPKVSPYKSHVIIEIMTSLQM